jgi:hypothetical protein
MIKEVFLKQGLKYGIILKYKRITLQKIVKIIPFN